MAAGGSRVRLARLLGATSSWHGTTPGPQKQGGRSCLSRDVRHSETVRSPSGRGGDLAICKSRDCCIQAVGPEYRHLPLHGMAPPIAGCPSIGVGTSEVAPRLSVPNVISWDISDGVGAVWNARAAMRRYLRRSVSARSAGRRCPFHVRVAAVLTRQLQSSVAIAVRSSAPRQGWCSWASNTTPLCRNRLHPPSGGN
jgi:hypothetical protein